MRCHPQNHRPILASAIDPIHCMRGTLEQVPNWRPSWLSLNYHLLRQHHLLHLNHLNHPHRSYHHFHLDHCKQRALNQFLRVLRNRLDHHRFPYRYAFLQMGSLRVLQRLKQSVRFVHLSHQNHRFRQFHSYHLLRRHHRFHQIRPNHSFHQHQVRLDLR